MNICSNSAYAIAPKSKKSKVVFETLWVECSVIPASATCQCPLSSLFGVTYLRPGGGLWVRLAGALVELAHLHAATMVTRCSGMS